MTNIVLATASTYKRAQFKVLELPFLSIAPDINETPFEEESPETTSVRLARTKARAISALYPDAYVIGCDQTAAVNGHILSKPQTASRAVEQLARCSGESAMFYSSVCIERAADGHSRIHTSPTRVKFRSLSDTEINSYIKKEEALDCAGGFKVEQLGIRLFERIESGDPSALIGLPMIAVVNLLLEVSIDPLT